MLEEALAMAWQYNLRPASVVRYKRQAFVGSQYDPGLRVTFDTEMTFRAANLDLRESETGDDQPLFPADWTILEIKVNERVPYWLTELVAQHNLSLTRVSKYCRSIELAQNLPSMGWPASWTQDPLCPSPTIFNAIEHETELART